jgi:hypothetical protein
MVRCCACSCEGRRVYWLPFLGVALTSPWKGGANRPITGGGREAMVGFVLVFMFPITAPFFLVPAVVLFMLIGGVLEACGVEGVTAFTIAGIVVGGLLVLLVIHLNTLYG